MFQDNCPRHPNPSQYNADGDLLGNDCDNCPYVSNLLQGDQDKDGIGDACDIDGDGDGEKTNAKLSRHSDYIFLCFMRLQGKIYKSLPVLRLYIRKSKINHFLPCDCVSVGAR